MIITKQCRRLLDTCFLQRMIIRNESFSPKTAIILSKLTRFEYEQIRNHDMDDDELRTFLIDRGSDYHQLKQRHLRHVEIMSHVKEQLDLRGIKTQVIQRANYSSDSLKGVDLVLSAGGDGTFLLGASKIKNKSLPLIGVNTDPERSEGYLCLPRKYSLNFGKALDKLLSTDVRWLHRKRIRITMSGKHANDQPVQLLEQQLSSPELRFSEHIKEHELHHHQSNVAKDLPSRVLPILSLNDIFIGESLSARVSYYELSIDGAPKVEQKCSGITICTGTGSSSWHFNINSLQAQDIRHVLKITQSKTGLDIPYKDKDLVKCIYSKFNKSLYFSPTCPKMAFTVRDPVHTGIYRVIEPRGFATRVKIRSKMWDACLVIDGGVSFQFNDGAEALLEMHDEDMLKTAMLD
ncbi:NAD kinase 2, mitochondrial-like [Watersipora subatra]|uniref:NAD kinase 2, mitochondrial-like n=1 Tax=Watersipora subatra TaxID=2589382 RepID=UPI00355B610C